MNEAFHEYAAYYDLLYADKDYLRECDFLESVFRNYSGPAVPSILDIGCGTGGHALPLQSHGHQVTGIDRSEAMLAVARQKASDARASIPFHVMDMLDFKLEQQFDGAICMFASLGYFSQTGDLLRALANIRSHLRDGALFIFDVWNGLAVLRLSPSERLKEVENGVIRLLRFVRPELDAVNHLCHNHYRLIVTQGNRVLQEVEELHTVRFFFPQELTHYLADVGFRTLQVCPFLDLDGKVDETVWNICFIARAEGGL